MPAVPLKKIAAPDRSLQEEWAYDVAGATQLRLQSKGNGYCPVGTWLSGDAGALSVSGAGPLD